MKKPTPKPIKILNNDNNKVFGWLCLLGTEGGSIMYNIDVLSFD